MARVSVLTAMGVVLEPWVCVAVIAVVGREVREGTCPPGHWGGRGAPGAVTTSPVGAAGLSGGRHAPRTGRKGDLWLPSAASPGVVYKGGGESMHEQRITEREWRKKGK